MIIYRKLNDALSCTCQVELFLSLYLDVLTKTLLSWIQSSTTMMLASLGDEHKVYYWTDNEFNIFFKKNGLTGQR